MNYTTMLHGMPQVGMPFASIQQPSDMNQPQHTSYQYTYSGEPLYLFPHMHSQHRNMTEAQMALVAKQVDPKPRLGKDEVQLLENEFQKNPKPSSLRKREIAELLKVDNPRINNWFQNRRAKAKQMARRGDVTVQEDVSPSDSSPTEQPEKSSMVSEYLGPQTQILPLRASSAAFPTAKQPPLAIYPLANDGNAAAGQSASPSAPSTEEYPSPKSLTFHTTTATITDGSRDAHPFVPVMNGAYLASSHHSNGSYSSHTSPQAFMDTEHLSEHQGFEQSLGAYIPFTTDMGVDNVMANVDVDSFQAELLRADDVPQLDEDLVVLPSYEVPLLDDTLSQNMSAAPSPGSAHSPASAISDLRFKSPPPPANIATRRNKGIPAMLNSTALRSSAFGPKTSVDAGNKRLDGGTPSIRRISSATGLMSNRIQKPSIPAAPRSPLYLEHNQEAFLQSLQTSAAVEASGGPPLVRSLSNSTSSVSPGEAMVSTNGMASSGSSDDEHLMPFGSSAANHNPYFATQSTLKTPPGTPGFHGLMHAGAGEHQHMMDSHWRFVPQDEALLTPSLASFGSEDFSMLQEAPHYVMNSQPPTPSVHQSLGHGYFPLRLQTGAVSGTAGVSSQAQYTFPGEAYMIPGSSGTLSPGRSKVKQFQFTPNVTPQDYNGEK
ncbi:homeobox transcription factor [Sporothrix schenckii 1099-18]|uniref:Homeobox domain-containing protein n=2 Tax=Sporothrix schenckii TaxID=29908 RepID=U7PUQ2_SPOS1|nr:homeobox transcription factor [Sporothrix schenckii 1099-18]ERS98454.1 hypothetical protein HMPREF1624_05238 [Sporothrix schenckii ATCC 58251]KJR89396.1 homeobox transcription factor [Sporothrix schenckii 1099-18]